MEFENKKLVYSIILLSIFTLLLRFFGYLPFHIVVELSSILIGYYIFIFAYKVRNYEHSGFFVIVGSFYLAVSSFDILHTLSYKGMGLLNVNELNVATQFWVIARLTESFGYLFGIIFSGRRIPLKLPLFISFSIFLIFSWMILYTPFFPDALHAETGLTDFKISAEYTVIAILMLSLATLFRLSNNFDFKGYLLLVIALVITCISEFSFTLYNDVYGIMNMAGHVLKAISFYIMLFAFSSTHIAFGRN